MLFSAGYSYAYHKYDNSTYFIVRQGVFAVLGVTAMLIISKINYNYFRYAAVIGMVVAFLLLVVVLLLPEWKPGFKRWINLGFITFQPSEIAKIAIVLFYAWACEKWQKEIKSDWKYALYFGGVAVAFAGLVYLENHVSGTILMLALSVAMLYLGGFNKWWFIVGIGIVAVVVLFFIMKPDLLEEYAGERITAWLDKDFEPRGARWQTNQSLNAIGSGGFLGQGLGESKQKHLYVSEPQNDFIFAIVCEELGFVGATAILVLFALLVWRGFVIAMNCRSKFGALLAMGIVFQVGLQTILNILVVTDTIPNTGISLPFFSYGGTSLVILLAEMGIVLSVSRSSKVNKK
ncbi:MAG: cell division protein FtsW [Clostridia bacterium]|nr:cell division protein FtsW [Clostridia bacterium]